MNLRNRILTSAATALLMAAGMCLTPMAKAQPSPANSDALYQGYLNTYLYNSGGSTYFTNSINDRDDNFEWTQAYEITGVEDAYERNKGADRQALISELLNTFITVNFTDQNSTNLSWDTWNDDSAWDTIALARGYQITGNTTYLTDAENVYNMAYSRGWTSDYGGGIWELQGSGTKCALSNLPFVVSGVILYQATGNSTYLTEAEAEYAWVRTALYNTSTGQVNGCIVTGDSEQVSTAAYDSGLMVNAANYLYRMTGNSEYYNDAKLSIQFQLNQYPSIMSVDWPNNGPFGPDQFWRGLSNFARWNNLWSTYSTWLYNNADDAWDFRNTTYNITWDKIATQTPGPDILSMETESAMVLRQVVSIQDIAVPFTFSGTYQIKNSASGLALTINGGVNTNGATVVQEAYTGGPHELWTFQATGAASTTSSTTPADLPSTSPATIPRPSSRVRRPFNGQLQPSAEKTTTSGCLCSTPTELTASIT